MSCRTVVPVVLSVLGWLVPPGAAGIAAEFTFGTRTLRVPDGYEVEQITTPSLVERPIAVSRDERGRLYVTDSGGMTERAEQQREAKPHRIRRLTDTDGDGHYDESTVFADRMMFPEGCLWFKGSLYVAAPPEIWKLTDTDDDGVADVREVWIDGRTLTGCGNDLHGPYAGLDGYLYWCKGAFAEQTWTLPTGRLFTTRAAHIFRARPDGTQIEPVLTGGMDNPVNVAFFANGERFLSCTFLQHPEAGRRDGLIHAIYGGVYGKKHDSILEHQLTGDVMPVLSHQGAAAPCGLIAGSETLFGGGESQSLFACYFNLHRIVRHVLVEEGATYSTVDQEFVACDHPDFHPTDVFEDADGSLLIVDTGGWYKVCCPTSQLAKPDVLGAVYRVRRTGQGGTDDPLGLKLDWVGASPAVLADRLQDPRLFVRKRSTEQLRQQGEAAVPALNRLVTGHPRADVRRHAVWTLAGIDSSAARATVRTALTDGDSQTRQAAMHVAGLWRDADSLNLLLDAAASDLPGPARAALEATGRIAAPSAVPRLLEIARNRPPQSVDAAGAPVGSSERILDHALIYSLIEIGSPEGTRWGLGSTSVEARRAALVALDQMSGGGLQPSDVIPLLSAPQAALHATAVWIVGHHTNWGTQLAEYFRVRFGTAAALSAAESDQLVDLLSRLTRAPEIQELLVQTLRTTSSPARTTALRAMTQSRLTETPAGWLDALAELMPTAPADTALLAVSASRGWPRPREGHALLTDSLVRLASRKELPRALRLEALAAADPGQRLPDDLFGLLLESLRPDQAMPDRTAAAAVLGAAELTVPQRRTLIAELRTVGPLELPRLLPAFEKDVGEEIGEEIGLALVSALRESAGVTGLRVDLVRPLLARYPVGVQAAGEPLLTALNVNAAQQAEQLQQLLASLTEGDIRRGHEVFMGRKAACNTCHRLGYGGGRLGPDLTTIGRVRNETDLLEAVVFPGASIVRGYEPVVVELKEGRTVSGIVISESRDEIVLGIDALKTSQIARSEIEQILPSSVSLMPNGVAALLTPQEISDLMAFLKNLK